MYQTKKKTSNYQTYSSNIHHDRYNEDSDLLNCKLFFGSAHTLDKNTVYEHFSQFGTVIDVYLRPETLTSGNVTFYELDVSTDLLRNHQYMELKDGSKIEIKEWKSREDLRAKDIQNIKSLRNASELRSLNSIEIINLDIPEQIALDSKVKFHVRIKNKGSSPRILSGVMREAAVKLKCLENFQTNKSGILIKERSYHDVPFEFEATVKGQINLIVKFKMDPSIVFHSINMNVVDAESGIKNGTTNTSERTLKRSPNTDNVKRVIIPAFPPGRKTRIKRILPGDEKFVQKIGDYVLPDVIRRDVDKTGASKINPWNLRDNWKGRMRDLLFIEEAEHMKLIRDFDLHGVTFEEAKSYKRGETEYYTDPKEEPMLKLYVPGLAEKRPSVLSGDFIYAHIPGTNDVEYEGYVHVTEKNSVIVLFNLDFHRKVWNPQQKFNVRFGMQRFAWRIMHHATENVELDVVWPEWDGTKEPTKFDIPYEKINLFDSAIAKNERQLRAIHSALNKRHQKKKVPFLLFGPFGTGKTKTLVELILQIIVLMKDAKILVCTPSNSAADVFAVKLAKSKNAINTNSLLRLYASHRPRNLVPPELEDCIYYDETNGVFDIPSLQELTKYKVIVSTCTTSTQLYGMGVGKDHFTHIIFDEAAQVMEPEALIPLSLANTQCTIIMAGDPKQLGPRFQNKSVQVHELSKSIMERLSKLTAYKEGDNRKFNCVDLVENYRSHKAIIQFSSKQFYGNTLKAMADPKLVTSLQNWSKLPNQKFPLLFYAVEGQDMRDADSPSFYNHNEILAITDLISHLTNENQSIKQSEIGVITPFYKQVQKIRLALRQKKLGDVKVSGIDEFQGKEYKALFLSTVRSSSKWKEHDEKYGLGLFNPRALNTAITRAMALLVVVSDPYTASQEKHFKSLMDYCIHNGSYVGEQPTKEYLDMRKQKDIDSTGEISGEEYYTQIQKEELLKLSQETLSSTIHSDSFEYHSTGDANQSLNSSTNIAYEQVSKILQNPDSLRSSQEIDEQYYKHSDIKMPIPTHMVQDNRFLNQFPDRNYIDKNINSPWMSDMNPENISSQVNGQHPQSKNMGYVPWYPIFNNDMFSVYSHKNYSLPNISIVDHQHEVDIYINIFRSVAQFSMSGNSVYINVMPDLSGVIFQTTLPSLSILIEFNEKYLQSTEFYQTPSVICINVSKTARVIKFQPQTVKETPIPVEVSNIQQPMMPPQMYQFQSMYGS